MYIPLSNLYSVAEYEVLEYKRLRNRYELGHFDVLHTLHHQKKALIYYLDCKARGEMILFAIYYIYIHYSIYCIEYIIYYILIYTILSKYQATKLLKYSN